METAEMAYEAYARALGFHDDSGGLLPSWHYLSVRQQDAWREGVHEAFRKGWQEAAPPPASPGRHATRGGHLPSFGADLPSAPQSGQR